LEAILERKRHALDSQTSGAVVRQVACLLPLLDWWVARIEGIVKNQENSLDPSLRKMSLYETVLLSVW
jgi:hypothetical protein